MALTRQAGTVDDNPGHLPHGTPLLRWSDEALPMTDHDFRVDLAIPPDEVRCPRGKAAGGHRWDHQDQATIEAIPELTALR